jgi:hypothetical protein
MFSCICTQPDLTGILFRVLTLSVMPLNISGYYCSIISYKTTWLGVGGVREPLYRPQLISEGVVHDAVYRFLPALQPRQIHIGIAQNLRHVILEIFQFRVLCHQWVSKSNESKD